MSKLSTVRFVEEKTEKKLHEKKMLFQNVTLIININSVEFLLLNRILGTFSCINQQNGRRRFYLVTRTTTTTTTRALRIMRYVCVCVRWCHSFSMFEVRVYFVSIKNQYEPKLKKNLLQSVRMFSDIYLIPQRLFMQKYFQFTTKWIPILCFCLSLNRNMYDVRCSLLYVLCVLMNDELIAWN